MHEVLVWVELIRRCCSLAVWADMFDWAIWLTASLLLAVSVHKVDKHALSKFWSWLAQHQNECIIETRPFLVKVSFNLETNKS